MSAPLISDATLATIVRAAHEPWSKLSWHDAGELDVTLLDRNTRGGIYTISGDTLALAPGVRLQVRDELGDVFIDVGDVRHVIEIRCAGVDHSAVGLLRSMPAKAVQP